jgi:hypothetical protein
LWEHRRLRTTVALSVALGLSSFVLVWIIQPYMLERGVPEPWFGPIWSGANLWVAGVALASPRIAARLGIMTTLSLCCSMVAAGYGLLALTHAWWGFVFYLLLLSVRGLQIPLLLRMLQRDAPPGDRATILSVSTMVFRLCFVVGGPLVGLLLTHVPLATALAILGVVLFGSAVLALVAFARAHGRHGVD